MKITRIINILFAAGMVLSVTAAQNNYNKPAWKKLKHFKPEGTQNQGTLSYLYNPAKSKWKQPKFEYNHDVAVKPKTAKVIVLIFNPVLEQEGGTNLIQYLRANDPRKFSQILADSIRQCSGRYINYEIVDFIELDEFPEKIDGFQYTDASFLNEMKTQKWHKPDRSNYRKIFEKSNLIERCKKEGITEIWMWGAGGFGFDELSMYFPNRYARFAPTENPWFYRPYDIPKEIGHTVWVMGFNYQVGADNMLHSYSHRCESILALVFGHGCWKKELAGDDPWNTYTVLNLDYPDYPSQVGNVHVPPNGRSGYDYCNTTNILTCANSWDNYPDLTVASPRLINKQAWNNDQFGFQIWWMSHIPKNAGYTKWGYNNWWVYIANTDENLPDWYPEGPEEFKINPKLVP